jgi:hypothetical protein
VVSTNRPPRVASGHIKASLTAASAVEVVKLLLRRLEEREMGNRKSTASSKTVRSTVSAAAPEVPRQAGAQEHSAEGAGSTLDTDQSVTELSSASTFSVVIPADAPPSTSSAFSSASASSAVASAGGGSANDRHFSAKNKKKDPIRAFFDPEQSLLRSESSRERESLRALFASTGGQQWDAKANWNSARPLAHWFRVKVISGKVVGVELSNNNLCGLFPASVGLKHLVNLSFSGNNLSGSVSWREVCVSMPALRRFDISFNKMDGFIDWRCIVDHWKQLDMFNISENQFEGCIPLYYLCEGQVRIYVGPLPSDPECIKKLACIRYVDISGNCLEGVD